MLPDLQLHIDSMVAGGDMVVSRYSATATDSGASAREREMIQLNG